MDKRSEWSVLKIVAIIALAVFLMGSLLVTAMSRWGGY
jgi:hypothetical protein